MTYAPYTPFVRELTGHDTAGQADHEAHHADENAGVGRKAGSYESDDSDRQAYSHDQPGVRRVKPEEWSCERRGKVEHREEERSDGRDGHRRLVLQGTMF